MLVWSLRCVLVFVLLLRQLTCRCAALIFYENMLTLSREVALIRRRRWTSATILLVVNRFVTLNFAIFTLVNTFKWTTAAVRHSDPSCNRTS